MLRCLLVLLLLLLGLCSGWSRQAAGPGVEVDSGRQTTSFPALVKDTASCAKDASHGLFRPECFVAAGRGDSLVSSWDAAFNAAARFVTDQKLNPLGTGATVLWSGQYEICNAQQGIILPQSPVASGGPGVDLIGYGPGAQLSLVCSVRRDALPAGALPGSPHPDAAIWMPVEAQPHYTQYNWHDFTLYANGKSSGCMDMQGLIHVSSFSNLILSGAAGDGTATSNCMRWGNSQYPHATANQVELRNISVTPGGATQGSGLEVVTTIRNGKPVALLKRGGEHYSPNVSLYLAGPPTSVEAATGLSSPCQTMGSIHSVVRHGQIVAVTMQGFSGCANGTIMKAFDPVFPVHYAFWFDAFTDSPYIQLNPQTGQTAGVLAGSATGNNVYQGIHICCGMPTGFIEQGQGDSFLNFYADGVGQRALAFGAGASATVQQSKLYWNAEAGESSAQAGAYSFGEGVGTVTISGGICNSTGMQSYGGYKHVVSAKGSDRYPATLNVFADEDCSDYHLVTLLSTSFVETLRAALNKNLVLEGSAPGSPAALTVEPSGRISIGGSIFPSSPGSGGRSSSDLSGSLTLVAGSRSSSTYTFQHPDESAPVCWLTPTGLTPDQLRSLEGVVPVITRTELHFEVGALSKTNLRLGYACLGRD